MAPHLSEPSPREALAVARAIERQDDRGQALAGLAPRLGQLGYLEEALRIVQSIDKLENRNQALAEIIPDLTQLPSPILRSLWSETLHVLAVRTRADLLADLEMLTPVIITLGGAEAVAETTRAIQDVGRWWP